MKTGLGTSPSVAGRYDESKTSGHRGQVGETSWRAKLKPRCPELHECTKVAAEGTAGQPPGNKHRERMTHASDRSGH